MMNVELPEDEGSLGVRNMHTFEHIGSFAAVAQYNPRRTNRILMSIYTVLVKAKTNVLLPFGPVAIMLHYLTGKQVRIVILFCTLFFSNHTGDDYSFLFSHSNNPSQIFRKVVS